MRKFMIALTMLTFLAAASSAGAAGQGHAGGMGAGGTASGSMSMDMNAGQTDAKSFKHEAAMTTDMHGEFQIMSLADMKMTDPEGNTHHVMLKLRGKALKQGADNVTGKIKVIGPNGKEQIAGLVNYNGILAANFTFKEKGDYGIICLLKIDENKELVKFWYPFAG